MPSTLWSLQEFEWEKEKKKEKKIFKTTLPRKKECSFFLGNTGVAVNYGNAKTNALLHSRAAKFLLLLGSVELSSEQGTDPSREPGASPSQPRDTGNQPHCQMLKYQWGNKGSKAEDFQARSPIPAWKRSLLCWESPSQMLTGAVLPSEDWRGGCGADTAAWGLLFPASAISTGWALFGNDHNYNAQRCLMQHSHFMYMLK